MTQLIIKGDADQRTIDQINRCAEKGDAPYAALCADNHLGYSMPIGGVVAYKDYVSPSGVGYDIGCGNKAVATNLIYSEISKDLPKIMDEIYRRISFGMGRKNKEPVDHPVIDSIKGFGWKPISGLIGKSASQLGTVGSGNHYVDLFRDSKTDRVWIGVHFGSRGLGHTIASGFLAMAQGKAFDERIKEGEMDAPPTLIRLDEWLGQFYIEAMKLAGEYAYAGRDIVCNQVLDILGAQSIDEVHNHHNFAWQEEHNGENFWVVRKGATPAFPGQRGFVGATMGEPSVILEGVESPESAELLYSTVHGAGRVMSRTEAGGSRPKKGWACNNRNCDWIQPAGQTHQKCPECGGKVIKAWVQKKKGKVDFSKVRNEIKMKGIELRGSGADEAPEAYKRLDSVLAAHGDTIRILHQLIPIGVAMAGDDVKDPWKD